MKITLLKLALTVSLMISTQAQADQQTITAIENASMELNLSELVNHQRGSVSRMCHCVRHGRVVVSVQLAGRREDPLSSLRRRASAHRHIASTGL